MATVYTMEAGTIYAGDAQPDQSNHLTMSEAKWPGMEENYVDHLAGGAPVGIEINTHFNKPEVTFTLAGWNPQVMKLLGSWSKDLQRFTLIGGIRDRLTGKLFAAKGEVWGRLGKAAPNAFNKGQNMAHEYAVKGVTHYELTFNGEQLWYWDFFTNSLIIGGVDRMAEMNAILGVPTADAPPGGREVGGASTTGLNA
jgi:phage tail tube protein FII